jgi:hypothetical protein
VKKGTKRSEERYIAAFEPDGRKASREPRKKKPRVFPPDPYPVMISGSCAERQQKIRQFLSDLPNSFEKGTNLPSLGEEDVRREDLSFDERPDKDGHRDDPGASGTGCCKVALF